MSVWQRFLAWFIGDDPASEYSRLDRADGLGVLDEEQVTAETAARVDFHGVSIDPAVLPIAQAAMDSLAPDHKPQRCREGIVTDTALDFGDWNPGVALQAAVDGAMAEYVEPDPVAPGQVVAVLCHDEEHVAYVVEALEAMAFKVERLQHEGTWYVWISDFRDTDPDDAIFEIGWYSDRLGSVGTIPDPRHASSRAGGDS